MSRRTRPDDRRRDAELFTDQRSEEFEIRIFGPAGEIRDAPVVRPSGDEPAEAPTLQRLQDQGRASRPRKGRLLDVAVKRARTSDEISTALRDLRSA